MTLISFIVILHSVLNQSCYICQCCKTHFHVFHLPSFSLSLLWNRNTQNKSPLSRSLTRFSETLNTQSSHIWISLLHFMSSQSSARYSFFLFLSITSIPLGLVYFQYFCTLSKSFVSSCSVLLLFPENFCNFIIACSILNLGNFSRRMSTKG